MSDCVSERVNDCELVRSEDPLALELVTLAPVEEDPVNPEFPRLPELE